MSCFRYCLIDNIYRYPHTWPPGPRSIPPRSRRTRTWCRAGWGTPGSPRQACRGWSPLHEICTRFARDLHNLATLRTSSPSRCRGSSEASSSPSELDSLAPAAAASRWDSTREAEEIIITWNRTYLCVYLHVLFDTDSNQSFFRNQPHIHIV